MALERDQQHSMKSFRNIVRIPLTAIGIMLIAGSNDLLIGISVILLFIVMAVAHYFSKS